MNSKRGIIACTIAGMSVVGLLSCLLRAQQQPIQAQAISTQVIHIGSAEVKSITSTSGYDPDEQPMIYWHDPEWRIDLVLPESQEIRTYSLSIKSGYDIAKIVKLPDDYMQIDSILRAPEDKVIVTADCGYCNGFIIVDLKDSKVIDNIRTDYPHISPNRRFILFDLWYPPYAFEAGTGRESQYRLYDTLRSPHDNTCGRMYDGQGHETLSVNMRGLQIFPLELSKNRCTNWEEDEDDENQASSGSDNQGSNFAWSPDSSKVVFADVKSGAISLVLVRMPDDKDGRPQTSIYTFTGAEDVCAGAANCDNNNVRSVAWNGDSINVALIQANQGGRAIEKDLTIPVSKFVPISGGEPPSPDQKHH